MVIVVVVVVLVSSAHSPPVDTGVQLSGGVICGTEI